MTRIGLLFQFRMRVELLVAILTGLIGVIGCTAPPAPRLVSDPDPSGMIPAMKIAVDQHDLSVVPDLVKYLENDDPAVRFYAIEALKKLTGQDLGYVYYAPADQRMEAVERWQQWLKNQAKASSTQPSARPPDAR